MSPVTCTIGITAHNEEANIGPLLQRMLDQRLKTVAIREIIIVSSGSTDRTNEIAQEWASRQTGIKLLIQPRREGKASAINLFMREAQDDVLLLCSADLQPELDAVENLVAPFADPEMGMTGSHPVPVNAADEFLGYGVNLLWELHHQLNESGGFKAGEMVAFRKIFERIPNHTAVDEASVEPIIRGQGYQVRYCGNAIVKNKGAETVADFIRQRRRIHAGHLELADFLGYRVSTMSGSTILPLLLKNLNWRPKQLLWTAGIVMLEIYGRFLGWRDYQNKRDHSVWEIATTTKQLAE